MDLSPRLHGASALASRMQTPLEQLSPSLDNLEERHIRAVVILLWPYSSATKQFSLLLSEPDFRLRDRKGQVRVSFRGMSAKAVAESQVGIGDTVILSLDGARFHNHDAEICTPGKNIDWVLAFSNSVRLEVYRDSELFATVKVEASRDDHPHINGTIPATPNRSPSTPQTETNGQPTGLVTENWASPAFSQKFSRSFGSLPNSAINPLEEEDGYIWGKGRKRTKFGRPSSEWIFVDTSPSPPPAAADGWEDEALELDEDQQDTTVEGHFSQGDTVPNSQATVHMDDRVQENEATEISEPLKQLLQSSSMDDTFTHSQTEYPTAIFSQNSSRDIAHSQQPTITPLTSFGNSFEQEEPVVNLERAATPPVPKSAPMVPVGSSLETLFSNASYNLPPSSSPTSSLFHGHDTTSSRLVTPNISGQTGDEAGFQDEATETTPEDVHRMAVPCADKIAGPLSSTPVYGLSKQRQFDHETAEPDHVAPVTSTKKRKRHSTELEGEDRQSALTMPQDPSRRVCYVDEEMIDEDSQGEKLIDEYMGGSVRSRLEEDPEEHVDEKHADIFEEDVSRKLDEDLEEELMELEEEMEERIEEVVGNEDEEQEENENYEEQELAEEERDEDMEIHSGDEMESGAYEYSPQLESEEEYESSGLEMDEDAFPPRPTYLAVPRATPEIIVLDSDDESQASAGITSAPQHVDIHSPNVPLTSGDIKRTNLSQQDFTTVGSQPQIGFGESPRLEAGDSGAETEMLVQDFTPKNLGNASRFDETPRQEKIGYVAETALHIEADSVVVNGKGEDTGHKPEDLNEYRHASPSFSGFMSDEDPETKLALSNEIAIDPQLYLPGTRRSSVTDSDPRGSVDHGLPHGKVADVDGTNEPRISLAPNSESQLVTPIEAGQYSDIQSSIPSSDSHPTEDELVASQLFCDMGEQIRDTSPQTPDLVNGPSLPIPHSPEKQAPRILENVGIDNTTKYDTQKKKEMEHADAIRNATIESPTIFQPNTNGIGLRSRLSYFSPLSTLADSFNKMTDTISVVISSSKISRSRSGPREYYTTLHLTEPSMSGITVCAQIFRRTKSSLPIAKKGDVILLRDFKVQSMDHKMMLLSMASSAWAVFPRGGDTNVQMNGPPVEFGTEEHEYIASLRQWYQDEGEQLAAKYEYLETTRGSAGTSSSISSASSSSPNKGRGSIFKKFARSKKPRHRRITIHELRDGRRYAEVGSPADKETIHELRDGTVYANL
ncbi:conserved hypothetical protein [Histoplasma capsulatum H143]|uniref:Telomeric single stranded DNA binding POT1/Cdc13 domain-containing protein n=1 Tax=Ajellomyces capsulatus (strain H143) TaxID=544712 RepID=C6HEC3_AJECH|nr:conserved hypothetical protein [Histoplasma capsulatum H143]